MLRNMFRKTFPEIFFLPAICAVTTLAADLPVQEVILYKHGVGYFERAGELKAGETARLDFKAGDMNDVLKSLTIAESTRRESRRRALRRE